MLKIFLLLLLLTLVATGLEMNMRGTDDMLKRMHKKSSKIGQRQNGKLKVISTRESKNKLDAKIISPNKRDIPVEKKVSKPNTGMVWENSSNQYLTPQENDEALKAFIEFKYPKEVKEYNLEKQRQKAIQEKIRLQKEKAERARVKLQREKAERARAKKAKAKAKKAKKQKETQAKKSIKEDERKLKASKKPKKMKREEEFVVSPNKQMWQDNENVKTTELNWVEAIEFCKNLTIEGYADWRLPSKEELVSIVDKNQKPAINKAFVNTQASSYWSKSDYKNSKYYAWALDFNTGSLDGHSKEQTALVRCVRGAK